MVDPSTHHQLMNLFAEGPPGAGWALEPAVVLRAGPAELLWNVLASR
jgi:hypothetical protein